jgi:hypothetical protein
LGGICVYKVLVEKPVGKETTGKPELIWEDNIKMHLQEVGCGVKVCAELILAPGTYLSTLPKQILRPFCFITATY